VEVWSSSCLGGVVVIHILL